MLQRHNAIKDEVMQLAQHAGCKATDSGLGKILTDDGRQGDTLFTGLGRNGTDLVVDYCIANACASSYVEQSCNVEGYAMSYLENVKITKYKEMYRRIGVDFMPFALEMHGAISDSSLKFIRKLASAASELHDIPYCIMFSYWQRRISMALQKNNAKMIYLAECKIAGQQPQGSGFADLISSINNEQIFPGEGLA